MKKGFTIVEVSILFVIFLIVAFLVAPLSLDDTKQAKYTSKWRSVQEDFTNIFYTVETQIEETGVEFKTALEEVINNEIKNSVDSYKITFLNGTYPKEPYRFKDFKTTYSNSIISLKMFEKPLGDIEGLLMYDVNGQMGPNIWGKDVFGLNIYKNKFEPFGKNKPVDLQKKDCSKQGTGIDCSNYYLIGGSFD